MATLIASAGNSTVSIGLKRPRFSGLWKAYSEVGFKPYNEVYSLVGGSVAQLQKDNPDDYTNACALRMSRGFNYGGYSIPRGTINPARNIYRVRGGDGLPYIMRVEDVIAFIMYNWGLPEHDLDPSDLSPIQGIKGVIVVLVNGWSDATGHVTLWDGVDTGDGSHYQDINYSGYRPGVKPTKVMLWELKN